MRRKPEQEDGILHSWEEEPEDSETGLLDDEPRRATTLEIVEDLSFDIALITVKISKGLRMTSSYSSPNPDQPVTKQTSWI